MLCLTMLSLVHLQQALSLWDGANGPIIGFINCNWENQNNNCRQWNILNEWLFIYMVWWVIIVWMPATSCCHTTLWLAILFLLIQPILLIPNNDLCYLHLPVVLKFVCQPKTSIYYRMCYWWILMPSCLVIRLIPSSWCIGISNTRRVKFLFWWCWPPNLSFCLPTSAVWLSNASLVIC